MEPRVGSFGHLAPVGVETPLAESGRQSQSQRKSAARWNSRRKTDEYCPARRQDAERAGRPAGHRGVLGEPALEATQRLGADCSLARVASDFLAVPPAAWISCAAALAPSRPIAVL